MRIVLIASPGLAADAALHGHLVVADAARADDVLGMLDTLSPELVVATVTPDTVGARALAAFDAGGVRLVAIATEETGRRHAASLGIVDVLRGPLAWSDIEATLGGVVVTQSHVPTPVAGRGTVIAVWGPAGAPGRTSLAVAIASEIAATGVSVVLGDADTHAASVAPSLGLLDEAPGFAAACRLAGMNGLDRGELERIAQGYSSPHGSFWVLTGLGRPARWPELQHDRVLGAITACRSWADVVVLDVAASLENDEEISSDLLAPRRNAATITALREADIVVAVGAADPVGLARLVRSHVELLELVTTGNVHVVANKVRATAIGLNPQAQVRQTLSRFGGIDDAVLVPWDPSAFDAALLSGRTLAEVAPRSPARQAIQQLVARMAPGSAARVA